MSEWSFIYVAYGLTWVTLAAYAFYLRARRQQAEEASTSLTGGREDA